MENQLISQYKEKKQEIEEKLSQFSNIDEKNWQDELFFCILTPQSQAKKCWNAVQELKNNNIKEKQAVELCLSDKTRFHKNKTRYLIEAKKNWEIIKQKIKQTNDVVKLRNWIAENVKGIGLKEASHFLRNIGKSNNKIAILDRHILKNLEKFGIINETKLTKKRYLEIEEKFKDFSENIGIPLDHLDLLFWSQETGEIFK